MLKLRHISTKLGLIYAALFVAMMVAISAIIYAVVTDRARTIISDQIIASSDVITYVFTERGDDLRSDTELQVRDFGFQSAVTSEDLPTINSALETLRQRLSVDGLSMIDVDGAEWGAVGTKLPLTDLSKQIAATAFDDVPHATGIMFHKAQPMLAGYVPVNAPDLVGFVVFADVIGQNEIAQLVDLSPIPLAVEIVPADDIANLSNAVETAGGDIIYRTLIPTLVDDQPATLVLAYPLSVVFAPFNVLILTLALVSLIGACIVSGASWWIAKRVVRQVAALAKAADSVRQGSDAQVIVNTGDELQGLAIAFNHMSAEVQAREEELRRRARLDHETMLPNRLALEETLAQYEPAASPHQVVLAIGIDRFSEIRGTIGFEASAQLLQAVYNRISAYPGILSVAILSGGTFAALLDFGLEDTALNSTDTLRDRLNTPVAIQSNSVDIVVTFGLSGPQSIGRAPALKQAIIALDQARSRNVWRAVYDDSQYLKTSKTLSLMGALVDAINQRHMYVAYQPKFALRSNQPIGIEALVRWNDPQRGKVFPDQFIPLAEETGHIERLTYFVLAEAILAQQALQAQGFDLTMSVNVSGRLVGNPTFTEKALQLCDRAEGKLCFEITETAVMQNPEKGIAALNTFVDAGMEISIDNYGSGLSSLAYLKKLPAQELKIDKEFIQKIDQSPRDAKLTRSSIDLAHSLGMKVTAEGIETQTALALLASMGCDIGQGYFMAKPMALDKLIGFLEDHVQLHPDAALSPIEKMQRG